MRLPYLPYTCNSFIFLVTRCLAQRVGGIRSASMAGRSGISCVRSYQRHWAAKVSAKVHMVECWNRDANLGLGNVNLRLHCQTLGSREGLLKGCVVMQMSRFPMRRVIRPNFSPPEEMWWPRARIVGIRLCCFRFQGLPPSNRHQS